MNKYGLMERGQADEKLFHRGINLIGAPTVKYVGKWMNIEIKDVREMVLDEDFLCLGFTHTFPSTSTNRFYLTFNGYTPFMIRGQNVTTNHIPFRIFWGGADYPNYFSVPYYLPKGTRIFFNMLAADDEPSHQFQLFGYYGKFDPAMQLDKLPIPRIIVNEMSLETLVDDNDVSVVVLERNADFVLDKIISYAKWDAEYYAKFGIIWGIGSYNLEVKIDGVGEFMNRPVHVHGVAGSIQHPRKINPQIRIGRGSSITSIISWKAADTATYPSQESVDIPHYLIYGGYDVKL